MGHELLPPGSDKAVNDDASHKFHFELNLTQKQIEEATVCAASLAGAASIVVGGARTKIGTELVERALPAIEDAGCALWASAIKLTRTQPKLTYFELKNGIECSFDKDISFFARKSDLISLVHPLGDEVHLLRDGSRAVIKQGSHYFYDQAGVGLNMPVPSKAMPYVLFDNRALTPINQRLFRKVESCFWTGYIKPLARVGNVVQNASHW
jgi:hypothetical protein